MNPMLALSSACLFGLIGGLGLWIYDAPQRSAVRPLADKRLYKPRNWKRERSVRTIGIAALISFIATLLLSVLTVSSLINAFIYLVTLYLLPLAMLADKERKQREKIFQEVILYANNMGMLLKQTGNVYHSLLKVYEDLDSTLKIDVSNVIASLSESRLEAEAIFNRFAEKYDYSIIENLHVIMLHMHYESSAIKDEVLNIYQEDVERMERTLKENRLTRKKLRLQYILITVGCLAAYGFLYLQLKGVFHQQIASPFYQLANGLYLALTLLTLFCIDQYFSQHITRE